MKILEVKNLVKDLGGFKLGPLSFYVKRGEIYFLIGPNGSGKTTTLKLITGLLHKNSGEIYLCGKRIEENSDEFKRKTGFIQDEPFVYPYLTGLEQILFVSSLYGIEKKELKERIEYFIKLFDAEEWINEISKNYSYGMKQKINIIQSLIHEPELLLIDEPLVALDAKAVYNFKKQLSDLKNRGKGILIATHSLSFAQEMYDRIGFIKDGKIIMELERKDVREKFGKKTLEEIFVEVF